MCRDASQSMENKENFPILFPESEILAKLRNTLASRTVIRSLFGILENLKVVSQFEI